jgi:xanthine/uracil permease
VQVEERSKGVAMGRLDEYKESLNTLMVSLSVLVGMFVLMIGGLISRYDGGKIDLVFWTGVIACIMTAVSLWLIFRRIVKKKQKRLERFRNEYGGFCN